MATFRDPVTCFAPLEVVERFLEIRRIAGFSECLFVTSAFDLADFYDAYGFDIYSLSDCPDNFNFGDYRSSIAPGGVFARSSLTAH